MAIKDKFFPSKQFVIETGLITLEMRLKPGFVKLWVGILHLYSTSLYFGVLFNHCFIAACYSALDCISTTFRMTRACRVEDFGVTPNWLGSIFSGWLGLRKYLLGQLWLSQGYRNWSYMLGNNSGWFLLKHWVYVSAASRWNLVSAGFKSDAVTVRLRCPPLC